MAERIPQKLIQIKADETAIIREEKHWQRNDDLSLLF